MVKTQIVFSPKTAEKRFLYSVRQQTVLMPVSELERAMLKKQRNK